MTKAVAVENVELAGIEQREGLLRQAAPDVAIGLGLGAVAYGAFKGQRDSFYWGVGQHAPDMVVALANSGAHPLVGFVGAAVGYAAAYKKRDKIRQVSAYSVATAANFAAEIGQEVLLYPDTGKHFYDALPETIKDYVFALGAATYFLRRRRAFKNSAA